MTGMQRRLTGRIQVPLPPGEAFRLFTPRGEQDWALGWLPSFPAPASDDTEPGTVFETSAHGQHTIWLVTDRQLGRRISYARVTPGDQAGTVTVTVSPAGHHSEAEVTYQLTAWRHLWPGVCVVARRGGHPEPLQVSAAAALRLRGAAPASAPGLRLVAWDGTGIGAAGAPADAAAFGGVQGGGPQLRFLALIECTTRALADAIFDGVIRASEHKLARRLLPAPGPRMLMADRYFPARTELFRLVTTVLDHQRAPAASLAALCLP